jgi:hypothetical protein
MGDRAIGLAAAHRRAVRPLRRIHQHITRAAEREPFVGARRGVALHVAPSSQRKAGAGEEVADHSDALGARRERAIAGDARVAKGRTVLRCQCQRDVEPIGGQKSGGAVRPFQQRHRVLRDVVEAEFGKLIGSRQPVEISMHQREAR